MLLRIKIGTNGRKRPSHMREPALYRCKCGARPEVIPTMTDIGTLYSVECPMCRTSTYHKWDVATAVWSWNHGNILKG
jgi:hypothetical protein